MDYQQSKNWLTLSSDDSFYDLDVGTSVCWLIYFVVVVFQHPLMCTQFNKYKKDMYFFQSSLI